jgi:hypothetical protein
VKSGEPYKEFDFPDVLSGQMDKLVSLEKANGVFPKTPSCIQP